MYRPEGSPFRFPLGLWPTPDGLHPWHGKDRWHGHGVLMLQRPGDAHPVWVFWSGPRRECRGWYVNLQEPFRRTSSGYDTQDLELDILVTLDGRWEWKDDELLEERVRERRFTREQVAAIRAEGRRVARQLDRGRQWWSASWAAWEPPAHWATTSMPAVRDDSGAAAGLE